MRALVAAACLALSVPAAAQAPRDRAADAIDFGAEKDNRELEIALPPLPTPSNLVRFDPGRPTSMTFYVDTASLSVLADRIIRYTVVVKGEGSENISYEGMRCESREVKTFAYGRADGTWSPARDPQWKKVRSVQTDGHRYTLYTNYFCPSRASIVSAAEGVDALRRGGHPQATNLGATPPIPR
jgi:hypothetical protein